MSAAPSAAPTPDAPLGRTALVTGGNRGIGLAIATDLRAAGYRVVVGCRSGSAPEGLDAVPLEVQDPASIVAAFDAAEKLLGGPVEILVANAGITRDQLLLRMSDEDLDEVIATNLAGVIRCARRASRGMLRLKRGRMIFISSVVGLYGSPGQVNYAASKAGLVGVARSIARELGGRRITANVVAPGFIDTAMTADLPPERRDLYLASIPAARFGATAEVAAAVRFLASPEAGYVNGAVLPVDGGLGMGH
ncbi:MAG: SDR family oxidoreductase [Austwickia sp.]|nr:SDR family oxidoreductase [Austwickia sp.]MBK8435373.1 SDR family oxidoreductase [Austwickia sp.]MBK9101080.1 SDR family oxidoreductase [Austwickia sp.]